MKKRTKEQIKKAYIAKYWMERFYIVSISNVLGIIEPGTVEKVKDITEEVISMLEDDELRKIATARYINFTPWEEIADDTYISRASIYRYNTILLEKVYDILRKEGLINGIRT